MVLALAVLGTNPRPVAAAWERVLTISFYNGGGFGDGAGRVTSDDGAIDCSWNAGSTTGDCSEHYILPNFQTTYRITLTLVAAASSYSCLSTSSLCDTYGAVQTFPIDFDIGVPGDQTFSPSFNLKVLKVSVYVFGSGTVSTDGAFCDGGYDGDVCGQYKWGQTAALTAHPGGSAFTSWSGACSGANPVCTFPVMSNTVLSAYFGHAYLTFSASVGGKVCWPDDPLSCRQQTSVFREIGTTLEVWAVPQAGYEFDHWGTGSCAGQDSTCSFSVSVDETIKAFFATVTTPGPTSPPTPEATATRAPAPSTAPPPQPTGPGKTSPPGPASSAGSLATGQPGGPLGGSPSPLATAVAPTATTAPTATAAQSPAPLPSPAPTMATDAPDAASGLGLPPIPLLVLAIVVVLLLGVAIGRRGTARRTEAMPPRA